MPAVIVPDLTAVSRQWPAGWFLHGQCQLVYGDAATIRLIPYHGNYLWIDGSPRLVPDAGVALGVGGLEAATTYLVAAAMTPGDGRMTLHAVPQTDGHATAQGLGIEVLAKNPRESLVGMVRLKDGAFVPSLVISWHTRRARVGTSSFTEVRSTTVVYPPPTEIDPEIWVEFLTWGDERVRQTIMATHRNTSDGDGVFTGCAMDGINGPGISTSNSDSPGETLFASSVEWVRTDLAEGYHHATLIGATHGGGEALWHGPLESGVPQVTNTVEYVG